MKKFMLFVTALFCGSMMLFAQDTREVVSSCNFSTPNGFYRLFDWDDEWNTTKQAEVATSMQAEAGAVYGIPVSMIKLEVKNGEVWDDIALNSGYKLKEDTKYRLEMQLRIDGTEYRFPDSGADLMVYVGGQLLEVLGDPINTYPNYSYVWVLGEFEVYADEYAGLLGDLRYNVNREKKTAMVMPSWDGEGEETYYAGDIIIPDKITYKAVEYTVTSIFDAAFAGCTSPLTVTIPATVKEIIGAAFAGASGLTKIDCKAETPPTITDLTYVFYNLDLSKIKLEIPSSAEAAYKAADGWNLFWIKTIYLNAGIWDASDPALFVHAWGGTSPEANVKMMQAGMGEGLYKAEIPTDHNKVVFARMETSATEIKWTKEDGLWNKTCDLDIPGTGHDCFLITGWNNGKCEDLFDGNKLSGGGWIDHDAVFYVTGDSAFMTDAFYPGTTAWAPDVIKVKSKHYWCNLKPNQEYKIKVTNGTWDNAKGIIQVKNKMELPGLKGDADENICFRISQDNTQLDIYLEDDGTITLAGMFVEGPKYFEGYYLMKEPYNFDDPYDQLAYFMENTEAPGEWMAGMGKSDGLMAGTKVLMVEVKNDAIVTWYPATKNPYIVPAEFAEKEINLYFRPAGKEEWKAFHEGGYLWIEVDTESAVDQITNDQSPITGKVLRDGQLFILRGEKVYTATGQEVK